MQPVHDYYEQLAPRYDQDRFGNSYGRYIDAMERAILRKWLVAIPPQEVLDLGCGTGRLLDFAMTGVDASPAMLQVAADKYPDRRLIHSNLPGLEALLAPADQGEQSGRSGQIRQNGQPGQNSQTVPTRLRSHTGASLSTAPENTALASCLPLRQFQAATCFHVFMHLSPQVISESLQTLAGLIRSGGSLIIDFPSQQRRALKRGRASSTLWHANTAATSAQLQAWAGPAWKIVARRGILFLPVHRLPAFARAACQPLDTLLCNSPLGNWASYHVYLLQRQPDVAPAPAGAEGSAAAMTTRSAA